jgi:hypothetical protein
MFFFADEVKLKGNEAYKNNDLYLALDYYEHVNDRPNIMFINRF